MVWEGVNSYGVCGGGGGSTARLSWVITGILSFLFSSDLCTQQSCFRKSAWWKFFYYSYARIVEYVSEYIFLISKSKAWRQKAKETKEKKIISVENLLQICSVYLTYLIESWISPGCSYELNTVYVQREKSQFLLYYYSIKENKRKSLTPMFDYHFLFYICLFVLANLS